MRAYDLEVTGSLKVQGDIKAENYIVETTVTSMTQSFASGSSKFGDGVLDSHQFTGSLLVSGSNLTIDSVGSVNGSSTSTGSFGVLQLNGSPLMSGDGDGFGINQTNPTADLHIGNSGVGENVEFLMEGGSGIHARFDGSGVFSFRRYNINFQINRHSTGYNGSLSFVNGGTLGSGATQEWRFHLPASDTALKLKDDDDVELIAFTQNKEISGSLASTGSFGRTVSGKFYASSNGAASNPEYSFTDDTDTGMYIHTTNNLGFATGGTARLNINGNGQVAINDTNPQDTLQIDHASGTGGNTLSVNANGVSGKGTLYVEGNASFGADVRVEGDIIAENYIVSSSTTYMTTSFSDGSTIFGDTITDTHQFTGSLLVTGSVDVVGNLEIDGALTEASTMRIKTNIETLELSLIHI